MGHLVATINSWWSAALLIGGPGLTLIGTEAHDYFRRRRAQPNEVAAAA